MNWKRSLRVLGVGIFLSLPWIGAQAQQVQVYGLGNVTPVDCSITIAPGGTAQNIITADKGVHGFIIMNIDNTNGSGEPVWMSFSGPAVAGASGSYPLERLQPPHILCRVPSLPRSDSAPIKTSR